MISVSVDFTQLPIIPTASFTFPELAIIGGASQTTEPYGGYQTFNANLKQLQGGAGVSEVRSLLYTWRPNFGQLTISGHPTGQSADFITNGDSTVSLLITDLNTLQSAAIPTANANNATAPAIILRGAFPFPIAGDANVRFLLPVLDYVASNNIGQGKGQFLFCNFDVPPFQSAGSFSGSD
jgi:hypothetical protein